MAADHKREANQWTYLRLRDSIKKNYPAGQFVAISGGGIVADAASFLELRSALIALRLDPRNTLVVQAGVDYPEYVTFFSLLTASTPAQL